jgi:hypothetical protein
MRAKQDSSTSFRALSVLLVILLLAILVVFLLLAVGEYAQFTAMLHDTAAVQSSDAGVVRFQAGLRILIVLGAVALTVAVILISMLSRDARLRDDQHAAELERQQTKFEMLHAATSAPGETQRAMKAGVDEAHEQLAAAAKICREVAQRLLDGSRFETAHLHAAGSSVAEAQTVMDEMAEHAQESADIARDSMQMASDETALNPEEVFYYFADLSRRMAQVSQRQSESVAGVGKSIESISEISDRNAESAAALSSVADDLNKFTEKQG